MTAMKLEFNDVKEKLNNSSTCAKEKLRQLSQLSQFLATSCSGSTSIYWFRLGETVKKIERTGWDRIGAWEISVVNDIISYTSSGPQVEVGSSYASVVQSVKQGCANFPRPWQYCLSSWTTQHRINIYWCRLGEAEMCRLRNFSCI
jgi:hypothetical protein